MTAILMRLFWQSAHAEQHTQHTQHTQHSQHHQHDHAKRPSVDFDKGQVAFLSSGFRLADFSRLIQSFKKPVVDCLLRYYFLYKL